MLNNSESLCDVVDASDGQRNRDPNQMFIRVHEHKPYEARQHEQRKTYRTELHHLLTTQQTHRWIGF